MYSINAEVRKQEFKLGLNVLEKFDNGGLFGNQRLVSSHYHPQALIESNFTEYKLDKTVWFTDAMLVDLKSDGRVKVSGRQFKLDHHSKEYVCGELVYNLKLTELNDDRTIRMGDNEFGMINTFFNKYLTEPDPFHTNKMIRDRMVKSHEEEVDDLKARIFALKAFYGIAAVTTVFSLIGFVAMLLLK